MIELKSQLLGGALSEKAQNSLMITSFSEEDMNQRIAAYDKATQNFEELFMAHANEMGGGQFQFAEGMGNANLRGTDFFDASVTALVTSIVPYFTIERGMDHISASLPYMDFYDIVKEDERRVVRPNLGLHTSMDEGQKTIPTTVDGSKQYSFAFGTPVLPGQVIVVYGPYQIVDDTRGNLIAVPGLLSKGTVNYQTGAVELEFVNATETTVAATVKCTAAVDYTAKDKSDAIYGKVKYYNARAQQMEVIVKRDIIQEASINKMGILNPNKLFANAMLDQYHIRRNTKLALAILNGYVGNSYEIDLSKFSLATSEYPAYINCFINMLEAIDQAIANRLGSVMNATAYLVGKDVKYAFTTLSASKDWVPNTKATYVVGLVGWWKSRPVVYSDKLAADEAFAACKTADGNLAPIISGQFLPLSNLPTIGDYDNISKFSTGIYSMESLDMLTSELLQRFTIKLPDALKITPSLVTV
jgi:hypothetical protein